MSDDWVAALVEASAGRTGLGRTAVVAFAVGQTKQAVVTIVDGRVEGPSGDAPGVTIPLTAKQLAAIVDGSESLAEAFMRGDVKPEGSTGPLLAAVELFEDASFRQRLAALV
ncbi:MAG: SCP2 sterol-binding domain-containing protein [Acidimicrobiales bacterium]